MFVWTLFSVLTKCNSNRFLLNDELLNKLKQSLIMTVNSFYCRKANIINVCYFCHTLEARNIELSENCPDSNLQL